MVDVVYFSSTSENTHRFVKKLDVKAKRIPLYATDEALIATKPYLLVVPTYGAGKDGGAVPKQVIRFLNNPENRENLRGVIAGGNTNFGKAYGLAADIIAKKCNVPVLHKFEIIGTPEDVEIVNDKIGTIK